MNFITTILNMRSPGIRLHKLALFGWAVVITAVLLLLSLPVLAGKPTILPALNLAICWKLLYNYVCISQSAGNLEAETQGILRDYTPKYFCYSLFVLPVFCRSIYTNPTKYLGRNNSSCLCFSYYLTGLIEGDGTIVVPKALRSKVGKLNSACIQIVFNLKDLPLALIIQKELGIGSLSRKKGVNAYVLSINSYEGLYSVISLINGKMRTPKIHSLYALIDFLNNLKNSTKPSKGIEKKPMDDSFLQSNAWLSGFIEADGSFQLRTTLNNKYPRFECKLEISQKRVDHKGYDNFEFLKTMARLLDTEVKLIRSNKPTPEYRVRTCNIRGNISAKEYLLIYPLFGAKYLDSMDWIRVVDMFAQGQHRTQIGKNKIVEIKSNMNDRRTAFTWDHLQKFYSLKI